MSPISDVSSFAALVDHTALKSETTPDQVDLLASQAQQHGFASVCVNSRFVSRVAQSGVVCCAVVGFPLGATNLVSLQAETEQAIADGAKEIDMVIPLGCLLAGNIDAVADSIKTVRDAAGDKLVKVIIESAALSDTQIIQVCELSVDLGADYVKTSTGFHSSGGASAQAVSLMRSTVGDNVGVKASGGIRSLADVQIMVDAGASRLGMSSAMNVLAELG